MKIPLVSDCVCIVVLDNEKIIVLIAADGISMICVVAAGLFTQRQ